MQAKLFTDAEYTLGESPLWDYLHNNLLWVDIENRLLCMSDTRTGFVSQIEFESRLSAVVLTSIPHVYLLAFQNGLKLYDVNTRKLTEIANPEKNIQNNRFNDGKCDPAGRFWVGSMDMEAKPEAGNLYCLEGKNAPELKLEHLTISNGMDWSIDRKHMYFIDTADNEVRCYDYSIETGIIRNPRIAITVPEDYGGPDGMCVDEEGMLWIAHWGGGNVSRWNPVNGQLLDRVEVPAPHVTSCCFGGKDLDTLYITTARAELTDQQLKEYPQSGKLFFIKPGVPGLNTNKFQL